MEMKKRMVVQRIKSNLINIGKTGVVSLLLLSLLCNLLTVHVQAAGIQADSPAEETVYSESVQVDNLAEETVYSESVQAVSPGNGVPGDGLHLQNGRYLLYAGGKQVTQKGWKQLTKQEFYYVNGQSYVEFRLIDKSGIWKCYKYNYNIAKWEIQKDIWKQIENKYYYFNKYGKCITIYDKVRQRCQKYGGGRMHEVKKDVCRLKNDRYYYFNSKGVRVTKKGFQKVSGKKYIQIGKSGYVTAKMENTKGIWRFYKYNYKKDKWEAQKSMWLLVNHSQYYFNRYGKCVSRFIIQRPISARNTIRGRCAQLKRVSVSCAMESSIILVKRVSGIQRRVLRKPRQSNT